MQEKRSAFQTVMLILAIILSALFIPIIVAITFGGSAVYGVSSVVSEEKIGTIVKKSDLFEVIENGITDMADQDIEDMEGLTKEGYRQMFTNLITKEDLETIYDEISKGFFHGERVAIDLSFIEDRVQERIQKIVNENMDDFFYAWKDGTASDIFAEDVVDDVKMRINSFFGVLSVEDMKSQYALLNMPKSFDEYAKDEWERVKKDVTRNIESEQFETEGILSDTAEEINEKINDTFNERDFLNVMESLRVICENSGLVLFIILTAIAILVLILLIFYLFRPAGFYVCFAGLTFSAALCGFVSLIINGVKSYFMDGVRQGFTEGAGTEISEKFTNDLMKPVSDIMEDLLDQIMKGFSKVGGAVFVFAIVMLGVGILLRVLQKNKEAELNQEA